MVRDTKGSRRYVLAAAMSTHVMHGHLMSRLLLQTQLGDACCDKPESTPDDSFRGVLAQTQQSSNVRTSLHHLHSTQPVCTFTVC